MSLVAFSVINELSIDYMHACSLAIIITVSLLVTVRACNKYKLQCCAFLHGCLFMCGLPHQSSHC